MDNIRLLVFMYDVRHNNLHDLIQYFFYLDETNYQSQMFWLLFISD